MYVCMYHSMNDFPVIVHLAMRIGLWDRWGNIASRFKEM